MNTFQQPQSPLLPLGELLEVHFATEHEFDGVQEVHEEVLVLLLEVVVEVAAVEELDEDDVGEEEFPVLEGVADGLKVLEIFLYSKLANSAALDKVIIYTLFQSIQDLYFLVRTELLHHPPQLPAATLENRSEVSTSLKRTRRWTVSLEQLGEFDVDIRRENIGKYNIFYVTFKLEIFVLVGPYNSAVNQENHSREKPQEACQPLVQRLLRQYSHLELHHHLSPKESSDRAERVITLVYLFEHQQRASILIVFQGIREEVDGLHSEDEFLGAERREEVYGKLKETRGESLLGVREEAEEGAEIVMNGDGVGLGEAHSKQQVMVEGVRDGGWKEIMFDYLRRKFYDPMWKALIRPARDLYNDAQLGASKFKYRGRYYQRKDFQLFNKKKLKIKASFFKEHKPQKKKPLVVFLHGNSSSRLTAFRCMKYIFECGFDVLSFDFTGSGKSQGEFVTLGINEVQDLKVVISYEIVLWGRSMGAVTALLYIAAESNVSAAILDSPFADIRSVISGYVKKSFIPDVFADLFLGEVRDTILEKTGADVIGLRPLDHIKNKIMKVPVLFIAAKDDQLVEIQNSAELHQAYSGPKKIIYCEGGHNDDRPKHVMDEVLKFVQRSIQKSVESKKRQNFVEEMNEKQNIQICQSSINLK